MSADLEARLTAFHAWRRRRALEAGLQSAEAILDEWKFKRMLMAAPADIFALESLGLLTAPLFAQYGDDLLALCSGRPTEDELPEEVRRRLRRRREAEDAERSVRSPSRPGGARLAPRPAVVTRATVRRDDPVVRLHEKTANETRRSIEDFAPGAGREPFERAPFEFGCQTLSFKYWETDFLERWGGLLDELASGRLEPASGDEVVAVAISRRERKAVKEWEQAWIKLVLRRQYEST